jgi:hypothetical protein
MERLQRLKQEKVHLFPGTGDRYIAEDDASPGMIEIQLRWKQGDMPDEKASEEALQGVKRMPGPNRPYIKTSEYTSCSL